MPLTRHRPALLPRTPVAWLRQVAVTALALIAATGAPRAGAEQVRCHVHYGGEEHVLTAAPLAMPQDAYDVAPVAVGSYFLFRIVFQTAPAAQASIKVYAYADRDAGPVPLHVARYPYPTSRRTGADGFTGRHWVYEPVRDGELMYWCALHRSPSRGRP